MASLHGAHFSASPTRQTLPPLEIESRTSYSYSPTSSPQLTPTLETVSSFVGASFFPSAYSSCSSDESFDFSTSSANTSCSSLNDLNDLDDHKGTSAPLQRTSNCRYAGIESVPMSFQRTNARLGGTGMVRSYSNPVATLEVKIAREAIYAEELKRQEDLSLTPHPIRRALTDENLPCNTSPRSASSLRAHTPLTEARSRPGLGRFLSFEPNLLKR